MDGENDDEDGPQHLHRRTGKRTKGTKGTRAAATSIRPSGGSMALGLSMSYRTWWSLSPTATPDLPPSLSIPY